MKTFIFALTLTLSFTALAGEANKDAPVKKERSLAGKKSEKEGKGYLDSLRGRMSGMSNKTRI